MRKKIATKFRQFFLIDDSPVKIAGGAAVGIFMGIVPGEGIISTLVVTTIFHFNRLAGAAGVLISNMWMTILVLPLAAFIGSILFGISQNSLIADFKKTYTLGLAHFFEYDIIFKLVIPLMIGYIIAAIIIAFIFFILIYSLLKYKQKN